MKSLFIYIISLLSLSSCIREDLPSSDSFALKEGDPLPEFTLSNQKETVSNKDLKNKMVLIIFFSTTCQDCQHALPVISSLYKEYEDNPAIRMLLVARDETQEQVASYFHEQKYDMDFFPDPQRKVYSLFAGSTIPRVFLADRNGTIILTQTEKVDAGEIRTQTTHLLSLRPIIYPDGISGLQ